MVDVLLIHPSYGLIGGKDNLRGKESLTPSFPITLTLGANAENQITACSTKLLSAVLSRY